VDRHPQLVQVLQLVGDELPVGLDEVTLRTLVVRVQLRHYLLYFLLLLLPSW